MQRSAIRQLPIRSLSLLLQTGLDEVERQAEERREETRDGGGTNVAVYLLAAEALECTVGRQLRLGLRVERQLPEVQGHGAGNGGDAAVPEGKDTLCLGDSGQGVDDRGVVLPLGGETHAVGLHADECEIGGVTQDGAETAGGKGGAGALGEGYGAVLGLGFRREFAHECAEEAHASCGVAV